MKTLLALALFVSPASFAASLPGAPTDPAHPGSKVYPYGVSARNLQCQGRAVNVFLPTGGSGKFALVVFGHGQALGVSSYKATFEHLAKKGVAVVFPAYDNGFFDQDWQRMGQDYVSLTECAVSQVPELDPRRTVYAGHSKGAYVASIAAGLAPGQRVQSAPRAVVLFDPAGSDSATLPRIAADTALTVVFADRDTVVSRDISEAIYARAGSHKRQLITLKSYASTSPALAADHMWPLTEKNFFGGGPEGPFHYYGSWKWLIAAANDLTDGSRFEDPFLYGPPAADKGLAGEQDDVKRNW